MSFRCEKEGHIIEAPGQGCEVCAFRSRVEELEGENEGLKAQVEGLSVEMGYHEAKDAINQLMAQRDVLCGEAERAKAKVCIGHSCKCGRSIPAQDLNALQKRAESAEARAKELRGAILRILPAAEFGSDEQSPPGFWDKEIEEAKMVLAKTTTPAPSHGDKSEGSDGKP